MKRMTGRMKVRLRRTRSPGMAGSGTDWLIRQARPEDIKDLLKLARRLDSVNLPADEPAISGLIHKSRESFASRSREIVHSQFLFVIENAATGEVVGSSQILDKHGIVNRPHIGFKLVQVEKSSRTMNRSFTHTCMKLEWNSEGITEIGGLIVADRYRSHPDKLGKLISYARFLYMSMWPEKFRSEVLAELLPPLDKHGDSLFWEYVGKKFTGMSYKEANATCRTNAEFMFSLFPHTLIYATILPEKVQKLIGAVHPDTQPVPRMLESIGFRFTGEVCPFDGGPHYRAKMAEITLLKKCRPMAVVFGDPVADAPQSLVAHDDAGEFRAAVLPVAPASPSVGVSPSTAKLLGVRRGQHVHVLPLK